MVVRKLMKNVCFELSTQNWNLDWLTTGSASWRGTWGQGDVVKSELKFYCIIGAHIGLQSVFWHHFSNSDTFYLRFSPERGKPDYLLLKTAKTEGGSGGLGKSLLFHLRVLKTRAYPQFLVVNSRAESTCYLRVPPYVCQFSPGYFHI